MTDASGSIGEMSLWDRVILWARVPFFVMSWAAAFVLHRNTPLHWRQRLAVTCLQAQRAWFPARHLRRLLRRVPTGTAVERYSAQHGIARETVTLDASVTTYGNAELIVLPPVLHILTPTPELGRNERGPTLVYFHGGGFVHQLRGAAHMPFIMQCATACRARQVAVLEYALAPEHPYPVQLVQCAATLRHLLEDAALRPGDLVLDGDSAGGELVGALLAHLARPSPYAAPIKFDGQFRAALFVSPFASLDTDAGSYSRNSRRDFLSKVQVDGFKAAWKSREDDIWANLCGAVGGPEGPWAKIFAPGVRDSSGR